MVKKCLLVFIQRFVEEFYQESIQGERREDVGVSLKFFVVLAMPLS